MKRLVYKITDLNKEPFGLEFITNQTPKWTEKQYLRHRANTKMELILNETTEEQEPLSRKVRLG